MKFLLDENRSPLHARMLRALGHDAVSVVELGLSGADDPVVRDAAIQQERILVTLDADLANVLRFPPSETPGVVRFRIHPATEAAIDGATPWQQFRRQLLRRYAAASAAFIFTDTRRETPGSCIVTP